MYPILIRDARSQDGHHEPLCMSRNPPLFWLGREPCAARGLAPRERRRGDAPAFPVADPVADATYGAPPHRLRTDDRDSYWSLIDGDIVWDVEQG